MDVMYQETVVLFLSASFFFFFLDGHGKMYNRMPFFGGVGWGGGDMS